ncbi:MAG: prolipoprotein diacylglyceryl transferase [Bacteroidota bacterium]
MRPILVQLGPFTVYSYGFMLAVGLLAALAVIKGRGEPVGLTGDRLYNLFLGAVLSSLAGARLTYLALNGVPLAAFFDFGHGGLSFFGGLAFGTIGLAALAAYWRIAFMDLADAIVPGLALGEAITRLGCDIFGKPASGWWAVWRNGASVYPVQLYSFALNFGIYLFLRVYRPRYAGQAGAVYLILLGVTRFVLEFVREGATLAGPLTWGHVAAVLALLAGSILFVTRRGRPAKVTGGNFRVLDFMPLLLAPMYFIS